MLSAVLLGQNAEFIGHFASQLKNYWKISEATLYSCKSRWSSFIRLWAEAVLQHVAALPAHSTCAWNYKSKKKLNRSLAVSLTMSIFSFEKQKGAQEQRCGVTRAVAAHAGGCLVLQRGVPPAEQAYSHAPASAVAGSGTLAVLDASKYLHVEKYWIVLPYFREAVSPSRPLVPLALICTPGCCQPRSLTSKGCTGVFAAASLMAALIFVRGNEQCPFLERISNSFPALWLQGNRTFVNDGFLCGFVCVFGLVSKPFKIKYTILCRNAEVENMHAWENLSGHNMNKKFSKL